jgi:hypothetical protein
MVQELLIYATKRVELSAAERRKAIAWGVSPMERRPAWRGSVLRCRPFGAK